MMKKWQSLFVSQGVYPEPLVLRTLDRNTKIAKNLLMTVKENNSYSVDAISARRYFSASPARKSAHHCIISFLSSK